VYLCIPFRVEAKNSTNKGSLFYLHKFSTKRLNKVTKADVIAAVAEQTGIDKLAVQESIESFFTVVKDSMSKGENIYVRGFGSFVNKKRAQKVARNISKNTSLVIEEHFVPSFKPAKVFVEQVKTAVKK
jgi:DNA-binding protein HU-beta